MRTTVFAIVVTGSLCAFGSVPAWTAGWDQAVDEATKRVVPDATQRARNRQRRPELRDLAPQEIWQDFR
jgi:hypothetical protein